VLLVLIVHSWIKSILVLTALHALHATRSSHEKAVCPSVCLFVCQTRDLWQNESCANILIPRDRTFILALETRKTVGRGRPLLPKILCQSDPVFNRYSLLAPQP